MPEPGELVFGPFILGATLGARRQIEICHATFFAADGRRHPVALRRTRALDDGPNEALLERAVRYAVVRHPNVAEVKDLGTLDGRSYVATELIRGHNLLRVLARCGAKRIGFPTDVALYIVRSVLEALDFAHQVPGKSGATLSIVHGDLCHTNVLLTADGEVRLTDFQIGLASTRKRSDRGANQGLGKGFTAYLAPEQIRGEPLDGRADLFAVGVILYELVTGRVLFTGPREEALLEAIAEGKFEVPLGRHRPDLHPGLSAMIRMALSPRREDRQPSARDFIRRIDTLLETVQCRIDAQFLRSLMARLFGGPAPDLEEAA